MEKANINRIQGFIIHQTHIDDTRYINMVWCFKILCHIKGDYLGLIDALEKSSNWESWTVGHGSLEQYCSDLLYILLIPEHKGNPQSHTCIINGVKYLLKLDAQSNAPVILQVNPQTVTHASIQPNDTELLKYLLVEVIRLLQLQHVFS